MPRRRESGPEPESKPFHLRWHSIADPTTPSVDLMSSPDPLNDPTLLIQLPSPTRRASRAGSLGFTWRDPTLTLEDSTLDLSSGRTRRKLFHAIKRSPTMRRAGQTMMMTTTTVPLRDAAEERPRRQKANGTPMPKVSAKRRADTPTMDSSPRRRRIRGPTWDAGETHGFGSHEAADAAEEERENDVDLVRAPTDDSEIWMTTMDDEQRPDASRSRYSREGSLSEEEEEEEEEEQGGEDYAGFAPGSDGSDEDEDRDKGLNNDTIAQGEDFSMIFMDSIPSLAASFHGNSSIMRPAGGEDGEGEEEELGDETNLIINNTLESIRQEVARSDGAGSDDEEEVGDVRTQVLSPTVQRESGVLPRLSSSPWWSRRAKKLGSSPLRHRVLRSSVGRASLSAEEIVARRRESLTPTRGRRGGSLVRVERVDSEEEDVELEMSEEEGRDQRRYDEVEGGEEEVEEEGEGGEEQGVEEEREEEEGVEERGEEEEEEEEEAREQEEEVGVEQERHRVEQNGVRDAIRETEDQRRYDDDDLQQVEDVEEGGEEEEGEEEEEEEGEGQEEEELEEEVGEEEEEEEEEDDGIEQIRVKNAMPQPQNQRHYHTEREREVDVDEEVDNEEDEEGGEHAEGGEDAEGEEQEHEEEEDEVEQIRVENAMTQPQNRRRYHAEMEREADMEEELEEEEEEEKAFEDEMQGVVEAEQPSLEEAAAEDAEEEGGGEEEVEVEEEAEEEEEEDGQGDHAASQSHPSVLDDVQYPQLGRLLPEITDPKPSTRYTRHSDMETVVVSQSRSPDSLDMEQSLPKPQPLRSTQGQAAKVTPVNPVSSSPIESPQSAVQEASYEKTARPVLSSILRAGRVLQNVTSDPPSPGDAKQLGSPFRSSASKESASKDPSACGGKSLPKPLKLARPQLSLDERIGQSVEMSPADDDVSWVEDEGPLSPSLDVSRGAVATREMRQPMTKEPFVRETAMENPFLQPRVMAVGQIDGVAEEPENSFLRPQAIAVGQIDGVAEESEGDSQDDETDIWEFEARRESPEPSAAASGVEAHEEVRPRNGVADEDNAVMSQKARKEDSAKSRFDLSAFFSSPAAIPGMLAEKLFPTAKAPTPARPRQTRRGGVPVFPQGTQKSFASRHAHRTDLFSPAQPLPGNGQAKADSHDDDDVDEQEETVATPQPRRRNQAVFPPSSARTAATVTPARMQLSHADISRWQEEASRVDDSPDVPRHVLRPLPGKDASPVKSSLRSPLKPRTPGRVVEFSKSVTSSSSAAEALPPQKRAIMSSAAAALPPTEKRATASASAAATTTTTTTTITPLSSTTWTRRHWLLLDALMRRRKKQALEGDFDKTAERLLGRTVKSQGRATTLERWHLDCVDAFQARVDGWDEGVVAKRLVALIMGEERRQRVVAKKAKRGMFH